MSFSFSEARYADSQYTCFRFWSGPMTVETNVVSVIVNGGFQTGILHQTVVASRHMIRSHKLAHRLDRLEPSALRAALGFNTIQDRTP
jgi:hypothetical protein